MPTSPKLLYLLTDGGRARFVRRSAAKGQYATFEEIDGSERLRTLRQELRASPTARSFSSASPRRSRVGDQDFYRPAKEAFVSEVADRAVALVQREQLDGVFIAAPARLLGPLKARLDPRIALAGILRKDLTKAPDHELGAWLDKVPKSAQVAL